jgi:hypothetical protein
MTREALFGLGVLLGVAVGGLLAFLLAMWLANAYYEDPMPTHHYYPECYQLRR